MSRRQNTVGVPATWVPEGSRLARAVMAELNRLGVELEADAEGDVALTLGELGGRASATVMLYGRERTYVFAPDGRLLILPESGESLPPAA